MQATNLPFATQIRSRTSRKSLGVVLVSQNDIPGAIWEAFHLMACRAAARCLDKK